MKTPTLPKAALALVLVAVFLSSTLASADETSISDPVGDSVGSHPDIVLTVAGHSAGGKLQHTISADHVFADPASPCLAIREVYPNTESLYVCADGAIKKTSNDSVVGSAIVSHPDGHTVVYTFTRKTIGSSSAYRWQAQSRASDCVRELCDVAAENFTLHAEIITYEQWALRFLDEMNAPSCESNRIALLAWQANEGTTAVFNPLATTYFLKGSTKFNSSGVRDYVSLAQGVKGVRLTLQNGSQSFGYKAIMDRLAACAPALRTAKAIRASSWCSGCSSGQYVTGLIDDVRNGYATYASKQIATYPQTRTPQGAAADVVASREAGLVPA